MTVTRVHGKTFDVIIVGMGVIGAATAYYLSRAGVDVAIVDRAYPCAEASGANAGFVGISNREPGIILDMALECRRLYEELQEQEDIGYERCGGLILLEDEEQVKQMQPWLQARIDAGLPGIETLTREELLSISPAIGGQVAGALFNPWDGRVNPYRLVNFFIGHATREGATLAMGTNIDHLITQDNRVQGVASGGEHLYANQVVIAAGALSAKLLASVGVDLPIIPYRCQIVLTEPTAPHIPYTVLDSSYENARQPQADDRPAATAPFRNRKIGLVYNQIQDGRIFLGAALEFSGFDKTTDPQATEEFLQHAKKRLHLPSDLAIQQTFSNFYALTPDNRPYVGRLSHLDGLVLATGLGGYGIGLGPITGYLVAQLVLGTPPSLCLDELNPDRF